MITIANRHQDNKDGSRVWIMEFGNFVQTYRMAVYLTPWQMTTHRYTAACMLRRARFEMQLALRRAGLK